MSENNENRMLVEVCDSPPDMSKDSLLDAVEEAKTAPTLFAPRERATYVKERVYEVRRLRALGKNDIEIKAALGDFVEKYPQLFQMAVEPKFDERQLNLMLGLLDKMAGGMSQHQASVIVGQSLANKFINPVIGVPTKSNK